MARKQNTPAQQPADTSADTIGRDDEGEGEAPATQGSQWAREKARLARAIEGGEGLHTTKAAHRFAKLADVLVAACANGEARVSFAQANERAALRRGATGDAAASWRLALQRTRQCFGGMPEVDGWRVDAEAGALVYTSAEAE